MKKGNWSAIFLGLLMVTVYCVADASSFSPTTIPGLAIWLRADSLTNSNGAKVTNWADTSGNHYDATNVSAVSSPTLKMNAINGLPALSGDGAHSYLATRELSLGSNFTVFTVANKRSTNSGCLLSVGTPAAGASYHMSRDYSYSDNWFTTNWHADACGSLDATKPVVQSFLCSGSNQIEFINGAGCQVGSADSFNVSGSLVLFMQPQSQGFYDGDISEVLIYSNTLSAADHTLVVQYLLAKYLPGQHLSFYGDSLTFGQNADYQQSYPAQVLGLLGGYESVLQAEDLGIGGVSIYSGVTRLALETISLNRTGHDVAVAWFGANDSVGTSVGQYYASLVDFCQGVQQSGLKVIVLSILPRPGNESFRVSANSLIRSNWQQFADAFADVGADPTIGVTNAITNALYYNPDDQTHLTDLGYAYVATNVYKAILTLPPLLVQAQPAPKVLKWAGPFTLQSAALSGGPYTNMVGAVSPYTNTAVSPTLFFRLRNPAMN